MKEEINLIKKLLKKQIILIIFLILLCIGTIFFVWYLLEPHIFLKGKNTIKIEVNSEYKELGAKASIGFEKITNIGIYNDVNTNKVGKYKVKYKIEYKNKEYEQIRTVLVEDTTPPVIELVGNINTFVCSKKEYIEEGFKAIDNYDGDITKKVKKIIKKDRIIYSVKDKFGNKTEIVRNLIVKDTEKPVINLNSDSYIYTYLNEEYIDSIPTAYDNCDGDLSSEIKINGLDLVDVNNIGEYEISYKVKDKSNNKAILKKIVKVLQKPNNDKVIYLTFDDGPSNSITPYILDILNEENVKATFFVINHSDELNYLIKREYDEGHTVALHSYSHNYGEIYTSVDAYFYDLEAINNKVESIIGEKVNIIRFPGGSSNTVSKFNPGIMTTLVSEVNNRGYIYFDWNVSSGDAGGSLTKEDVYNSVINDLNDRNNIILMHDFEGNNKTLDALRDIIRYAKNNGYSFDRITDATPKIRHGINN